MSREPLTMPEAIAAGYAASKLERIREVHREGPAKGMLTVSVRGREVSFPLNADQTDAMLAVLGEREMILLTSLGVDTE